MDKLLIIFSFVALFAAPSRLFASHRNSPSSSDFTYLISNNVLFSWNTRRPSFSSNSSRSLSLYQWIVGRGIPVNTHCNRIGSPSETFVVSFKFVVSNSGNTGSKNQTENADFQYRRQSFRFHTISLPLTSTSIHSYLIELSLLEKMRHS